MTALDTARKAEKALKEAGQMVAKKINDCWNPELRRYDGDIDFLHDLVNKQVVAIFSIHELIRQLEGSND